MGYKSEFRWNDIIDLAVVIRNVLMGCLQNYI